MTRTIAELTALAAEDPRAVLLPGEVATLFHVDPKTVSRWALTGKLASIRTPGGHHRFHVVDVLAALRADS